MNRKTNKKFETREAWLNAAVDAIQPIFSDYGHEIPICRVSCGWPSRGAIKHKGQTIGQAWSSSCSGDETPEIFISPVLGADEVASVLSTLVHEAVHIIVGSDCGHRGAFKGCATQVGLEGKMTETYPNEELAKELSKIAKHLGVYPHAKITPKPTEKKNKNRHLKLECSGKECDFTCRASNGSIEEFGFPWHCEKEMAWETLEKEEEEPKAPVPIKDLSEKDRKAHKAANDKASKARKKEAKKEAEEERKAALSDKPLQAKIGVAFHNLLRSGKQGKEYTTSEFTLIRYVDGKRFEYSEDGGTMWLEGTCKEKLV